MPRRRIFDVLQNHRFWAFDATGNTISPVFTPLFGFSAISAPEISADIESFKDGTFLYNRNVIKGGTVSSITFERAATFFDTDFYSWMIHAVHGDDSFHLGENISSAIRGDTGQAPYRRDIVIVQHSGYSAEAGAAVSPFLLGAAGFVAEGGASLAQVAGGAASIGGMFTGGLGPFQFADKIPARAWFLHGCIPINYTAASNFDAQSAEPSIQELEVQPEYIEEISLGVKP